MHIQKPLLSLNARALISTKIFWFRFLILSGASGVQLPLTKSVWFDLLFELLQVARPQKSEMTLKICFWLLTKRGIQETTKRFSFSTTEMPHSLFVTLTGECSTFCVRSVCGYCHYLIANTGNCHICLSCISSPFLSVLALWSFSENSVQNVLCPHENGLVWTLGLTCVFSSAVGTT